MEGSRIVAGCLPMVSPSIDLDSVASHDRSLNTASCQKAKMSSDTLWG